MTVREKDRNPPIVLRAHRPKHADTQSSGIPYADVQSEREVVTEDFLREPTWVQRHLFHIGIGMCAMLAIFWLVNWYVLPFLTQTLEHWNCGQDRICQYDLNVGHDGTSHFLTQYWHSQVIVIELPNNDPSKTRIYSQQITAIGDDSQHTVTLQTAPINPHPIPGKPDLVATISGFAAPVIFYNTGNGFSTEAPNG